MNRSRVLRSITKLQYAVLALAAILLLPLPSFAGGCDITSTNQDASHVHIVGACDSYLDAKQACIDNAQIQGYSDPNWCHFGDAGNGAGVWEAGWLCSPPGPPGTCPATSTVYLNDFYPLNYYVSAHVDPRALCGKACNTIKDPINPVSGAMLDTDTDVSSADDTTAFDRFYNSTDSSAFDLSVSWRHSFSRNVKAQSSSIIYQPYQSGNPDYSSTFTDPSVACTTGFSQVKSRVSNWASATASYTNGVCVLSRSGVSVGTLQVFAFQPQPLSQQISSVVNALASPTIIGIDVTRDDGQLIKFMVNGGVITVPPGIGLKLQQTTSGFTVTDLNDNVEQYDMTGKLLSITSRSGVVQTMSYDGSNRLTGVSDSFGHQLILNYDGQGHLTTVTRQ